MNDRRPSISGQIGSGADLPLDDWLNLASIMRKRRARLIGDDLFIDPAWAIILALGRAENRAGLDFSALVEETGQSATTTSRWLSVMKQRGLIVESSTASFVLSDDGIGRLRQVFA